MVNTMRFLKLKQASGILRTPPKDLQNLVQFGVLKPKRRRGLFVFDRKALAEAQVALYLKNTLGLPARLLAGFVRAFSNRARQFAKRSPAILVFRSGASYGTTAVEVRVPFAKLAEELERRLRLVELYRDLPRGRKRAGWKAEFLTSVKQAARELGEVSEEKIFQAVRSYRKKRRTPEITVVARNEAARA